MPGQIVAVWHEWTNYVAHSRWIVCWPIAGDMQGSPRRLAVWAGALATIAVLVATTFGASALARGASTSHPLVTPAQARAELAALWPMRETARSTGNTRVLEQIDTGAALERDVGDILNARGEGQPSPWAKRAFGPSIVVVPSQTHYPVSFLAFVETTGDFPSADAATRTIGYETVMLVITKSSASSSWRVAHETQYGGSFGFAPPPADAYAMPIPQSEKWVSPIGALQDLAHLDELEVARGVRAAMLQLGTLFAPGAWTTGNSTAVIDDGRNGLIDSGTVREKTTFSVDPHLDPIYEFNAPGAVNLVCGTIRVTTVNTPERPGGVLGQNSARTNWGGWLRPGYYTTITDAEMNQVCLGTYPLPQTDSIYVISGEFPGFDAWTVTGTPASRPGVSIAGPRKLHSSSAAPGDSRAAAAGRRDEQEQ